MMQLYLIIYRTNKKMLIDNGKAFEQPLTVIFAL